MKSSTIEWPDGLRAAVSLSFDDARTSQIDTGMPLLKELGLETSSRTIDAWSV